MRDLSARLVAMATEPSLSECVMSGGNAGRLYDSKPSGVGATGVVGVDGAGVHEVGFAHVSAGILSPDASKYHNNFAVNTEPQLVKRFKAW